MVSESLQSVLFATKPIGWVQLESVAVADPIRSVADPIRSVADLIQSVADPIGSVAQYRCEGRGPIFPVQTTFVYMGSPYSRK